MAASLRVFLDSNVVLSAFFSDRGAPSRIFDVLAARLPPLHPLIGEYNLIEIERNLGKRLPEARPLVRALIEKLGFEIIPLPGLSAVSQWIPAVAPKDAPVIASAVAGKTSVLVTGDKKDLLGLEDDRLAFPILSPTVFLDSFLPRFLAAWKK
ncbi:MAG: PIN domain-containing protein [Acidobacteriota bacterium]|nr:PIN domain-containing protein [Acidobacteriota bacterium]